MSVEVDGHIHTLYSRADSKTRLAQIESAMSRSVIRGAVVTDHNTIGKGVIVLAEENGRIIVGEEIVIDERNPRGSLIEVAAWGLRTPISSGQTIEAVIEQVRQQRGLMVVPHPFSLWRHGADLAKTLETINLCHDANVRVGVEVFNARAATRENALAQELWKKQRDVYRTAGSDAHHWREIGRAKMEVNPFSGFEGLMSVLANVKINGNDSSFWSLYFRLLNRAGLLFGRTM